MFEIVIIRGLQIIGFFLVVVIINFFLAIIISKKTIGKVQIISHRGGPILQPENTILAFKQAIDDGVDAIEFDVQMTSDGYLVIFHDEEVARTTNGTGLLKDMTFKEIRQLDAGKGQQVPTFEEVIDLAKNTNIILLAEAKNPLSYPGIEKAMLDALIKEEYLHHTIVQSFSSESLNNFESLDQDIKLCKLYGKWELRVANPQAGNAKIACILSEMLLFNPWMILQAHRKGFSVYCWPGKYDTAWLAKIAIALGADGIISDDQLMLKNLLSS